MRKQQEPKDISKNPESETLSVRLRDPVCVALQDTEERVPDREAERLAEWLPVNVPEGEAVAENVLVWDGVGTWLAELEGVGLGESVGCGDPLGVREVVGVEDLWGGGISSNAAVLLCGVGLCWPRHRRVSPETRQVSRYSRCRPR